MADVNQIVLGSHESPAIDALFIIICIFIIFTMQIGFGLLESGTVRTKNETNVIVRCMVDLVVGGTAYWCCGYALAYGPTSNTLLSWNDFFLDGKVTDRPTIFLKFLFQLTFATTTASIVSGAVTERIKLKSYILFTFFNVGFIYPIIEHWMWNSNGWLKLLGAYDFAGSSVVHITGGTSAFIGALILGPRRGRFFEKKKHDFRSSKPMNILLGTFFLFFGWIGFNCGSVFGVTNGMWQVTLTAGVVTTLGGFGGGIAILCLSLVCEKKRGYFLDVEQFASGILAGLVSITAIASQTRPSHGFVIGFIGSLISTGVINLVNLMRVDDPVSCFGIHWVAGAWGMIAVGFLAERNEKFPSVIEDGILRGGGGYLLAINFVAVICITLFSAGMTAGFFLLLYHTIGLRLTVEEEELGSDHIEHGIKKIHLSENGNLDNDDHESEDDEIVSTLTYDFRQE